MIGCSLFLVNCEGANSEQTTTSTEIMQVAHDSIRSHNDLVASKQFEQFRLNYTDENGLKQGKWEEIGWKDRVVGFQFYLNDTLHGPWESTHGITTVCGDYEYGIKVGYEKYYFNEVTDSNNVSLLYYENGEPIWGVHPKSEQGLLILSPKSSIYRDSVYMKAPFSDGALWYEGLFVHDKPQGTHKVYYPNGALHGWVDYTLSLIHI